MLENTFKFREGKSAIIIGPRGTGKTKLVESALFDIKNDKKYEFFTIRINGSFFKDDNSAIKEIARQLDWYLMKYNPNERENLKRATFEQKTVTSTMDVIINILDRTRLSEENEEKENEQNMNVKKNKKSLLFIPIVFVIDEIDRYTHNAKQTLLYNLFDLAQSSSKTGHEKGKVDSGTTISVLGISTKTTIREQLEKRVKSRFSQRIIQINKVKDLDDFCGCIYNMVYLPDVLGDEVDNKFRAEFNEIINKNIYEKGNLRKLIVENFYTIKDLNAIRNELILYIMNDFENILYQHMKDYRNRNIDMMKGLSEVEIKLLICCCRAKLKNNVFQINFDMAFDEYSNMVMIERRDIQSKIQVAGMSLKESDGTYLLDRDALQICWERLCSVGLLERHEISFSGMSNMGSSRLISGSDGRNGKDGATGPRNSFMVSTAGLNSSMSNMTANGANITPTGVAVCGVELDDIILTDSSASSTWLQHWKKLA